MLFKEESSNTLNDVLVKTNNPSNYIVESDFASNIWYIIIPILTLIISLSTTLFLMPIEDGINYIKQFDNVEAIWYSNDNEIIKSEGFKKYE